MSDIQIHPFATSEMKLKKTCFMEGIYWRERKFMIQITTEMLFLI